MAMLSCWDLGMQASTMMRWDGICCYVDGWIDGSMHDISRACVRARVALGACVDNALIEKMREVSLRLETRGGNIIHEMKDRYVLLYLTARSVKMYHARLLLPCLQVHSQLL